MKHLIQLILLIGIIFPSKLMAQEFSVASFRVLPNDVSAFINVVYDLNDDACALVKVVAPSDFAFSTPLGIVKRKDEVGEIWLYIPKGSRMITLKHPEWGVMRDYRFEKPLESHMSYELRLNLPSPLITELHDTIETIKTDTITIERMQPKVPLAIHALATMAMHKEGPSYGVFFAMMRRNGLFVHYSSNMKSLGNTSGTCKKDGSIDGDNVRPYYSGNTRHSNYTITAGGIHNIYRGFCLFEGIGYGKYATAWQLSESEGGKYLQNKGLSHEGFTGELGFLASVGRISFSASAITITAKQWQACIGIGIKL